MPVMPIPTSAPKRSSAPSRERLGDLRRDGAELRDQRRIDAGQRDLGLVRVHDHAAEQVRRRARRGRSGAPASSPPVHDSATATVRAAGRSSAATCSSTVEPSSREQLRRPWRARMNSSERGVVACAARLVPRRDLDLAAAQAGRDLERRERRGPPARRPRSVFGDLGLGDPDTAAGSPAVRRSRRRPPRANGVGRARGLPHRLKLARRPGQHHDRRAVGAVRRRRRPAPARSRPARAPSRPAGITACLRLDCARSRRGRGPASARISGARISAIRCSSASSSTISRPAEAPDDLGREVVGGRPEAAAGDDQRHPARVAMNRSAASRSSGRSPTIWIIASVDAELAQALGQPRAVAVGDDPGQDLGARDQDPGRGGAAGAHVQRRRLAGRQQAALPLGCSS